MTPDPGKTSLVIAGAWNLPILQPDWVGARLFDVPQMNVQLALLDTGGVRADFALDALDFSAMPGRVEFRPKRPEDACLEQCESAAKRLLELLPETPVTAFGVNFGFILDPNGEATGAVLSLPDAPRIRKLGGSVESTVLSRTVRFDDSIVNMLLRWSNGGPVTVELNHHTEINGAARSAAPRVSGALLRAQEFSTRMLKEVYG